MENTNPNITPDGNFTLTYFPGNQDAKPHTPLEEAIQYLCDCLPHSEEETLQNLQRYGHRCRPLTRKTRQQLLAVINNVLQPACEEGNQDALYWMFYAYNYGLGVKQDQEKALEYMKVLAEYGYPDMQCELGTWYETIDWDSHKGHMNRLAVKWFTKAAKQGNVEAMYYLGECYMEMFGVRHSVRKAMLWLRKAAKQGNWYAQLKVADCYFKGNGIKLDYKEAINWYELAAAHPDKEVCDWDYPAQQLAQCYQEGLGVKKDLEKTAEWYDKAECHNRAELIRKYGDDADLYDPDFPF